MLEGIAEIACAAFDGEADRQIRFYRTTGFQKNGSGFHRPAGEPGPDRRAGKFRNDLSGFRMFLHQADSVDIFKIRNRFISNGEYGYFNLHALVSRRNSLALPRNGCFTALSIKNPDRSFPGTGFNTLFRHSRICRR